MSDLYFAFGSNLDIDDWTAFCRGYGHDPMTLTPVGRAWLRDHRLVFDYRSMRRGGGALEVRTVPGGHVDGCLFRVGAGGWAALDQKEGHPLRYEREKVSVRDADGRTIAAWTYRVIPAHRTSFCAPTSDYLEICRRGRERLGLPLDNLIEAANFNSILYIGPAGGEQLPVTPRGAPKEKHTM